MHNYMYLHSMSSPYSSRIMKKASTLKEHQRSIDIINNRILVHSLLHCKLLEPCIYTTRQNICLGLVFLVLLDSLDTCIEGQSFYPRA